MDDFLEELIESLVAMGNNQSTLVREVVVNVVDDLYSHVRFTCSCDLFRLLGGTNRGLLLAFTIRCCNTLTESNSQTNTWVPNFNQQHCFVLMIG